MPYCIGEAIPYYFMEVKQILITPCFPLRLGGRWAMVGHSEEERWTFTARRIW